jgi:hypothetical protein
MRFEFKGNVTDKSVNRIVIHHEKTYYDGIEFWNGSWTETWIEV